jgi:hypothetical protein
MLRPTPGRAETHIYVSFSVGGAVVIGAGVVFWSLSYTSRVSERKPREENPNRRPLFTSASASSPVPFMNLRSIHRPRPYTAEEGSRGDLIPAPDGPRAASSVGVPLLVLRW